jgi:nucleoside-diphosphate-sugar epimerase
MDRLETPPRLLLTGATGYIGGTVLHHILSHDFFNNLTVTVPIRGQVRASELKSVYGSRVSVVQIKDLDDTTTMKQLASNHDIVINAGTGFHPPSAIAMVEGLAQRKAKTNRDLWMIHTSGVTNIGDHPITGVAYPDREWDDSNSLAVYEFEKAEEVKHPYLQRTAELAVLETAVKTAVKAVSIQVTGVYGVGEGLFQRTALVVPLMVQYVLAEGYAFNLGKGTGVIDKLHIYDLAELYVLLLKKIIIRDDDDVPTGKEGIIFAADNIRLTHRQNAQNALDAVFKTGKITSKEIKTLSLTEAAKTTAGLEEVAESLWASHKLTKSTLAYRWGWKPTKGEGDFLNYYTDMTKVGGEGPAQDTIASAMAMG